MESEIHNIIIIGSGPAAYSACLYCLPLKPIMLRGGFIGSIGPGGQLTTTTNVDNYPGFPHGIQGPDLMDNMHEHAQKLNVVQINEMVTDLEKEGDIFKVYTEKKLYKARSVVIGTGASAKRLYVEGTHDNELWQKGISACAVCDGFIYKNKVCCVIGGGDSALEELLYLSKICKKVYIIHRRNEFRCRKDKYDEMKRTENIEILTPYELKSAHGKDKLEYVILQRTDKEEDMKLEVDGLFFGIGHIPNTKFLEGNFGSILDTEKYIIANEDMSTSVEGLYCCGDVCDKKYRQAVTAAASGCLAGISAVEYAKKLND